MLTDAQMTGALNAVAAWMGRRGWGTDDGGPAPTGRDAAYRGLGPMLVEDWDWPSEPTPTIILEGGPYDWAIEVAWDDTVAAELRRLGIFAEPYAGYALCLYPS